MEATKKITGVLKTQKIRFGIKPHSKDECKFEKKIFWYGKYFFHIFGDRKTSGDQLGRKN